MASAGRNDRRFKEIARRLRKQLPPVCHLCSEAIDLRLPANSADSWTLDHIMPLKAGGDPWDENNLAPAHRRCNSSKGGSDLPQASTAVFSRQWR